MQNKILELMPADPQAAMALAVEHYTGLIWKTVQKYLENPEDIKECVNDTFMEFYIHRERFDPSRGSLEAFLTGIARKRAVSRYRKNRVRETVQLEEAADRSDPASELETKMDLERAMSELKEEDREIIRMKYFVGMTIQEIADSLQLPYETVKKRHQRSLARMRLVLIAAMTLLLVLLLAACAYIVVPYFGVVPGYGITETSDLPIFGLEEEITIKNEIGEYVLKNAFLVDGEFVGNGSVKFYSDDPNVWRPGGNYTEVAVLQYGDETYICPSGFGVDGQGLEFDMSAQDVKMPDGDEEICEAVLSYAGVEFRMELCRSGTEEIEKYNYWLEERGGLLAVPELRDGNLCVDVYPLNVGAGRIWCGDLTVESPDGRILTGRFHQRGEQYASWNFGEAGPGEYVLHIPDMERYLPYEGDFSIPVNLETCQWEDGTHEIPGGTVEVVSCRRLETVAGEKILDTDETAMENFDYWVIGIKYRMEETEEETDETVEKLRLHGECTRIGMTGQLTEITVHESEDGVRERLVCMEKDSFELSQYRLVPDYQVTYYWKCDASISFTVKAEE